MDQGTPLFHQVVRNVPVLHPRHQALVSRQVRETSLASMVGTPDNEDDAEQHKEADQLDADDIPGVGLDQPGPVAEETPSIVNQHVKKRKLYRQLSGTEVPWFPHDNDMELLKEFC